MVSDRVYVADIEGLNLAVVVVQDQVGNFPRREVDPILLLLDEGVHLHVVVVTMGREFDELTL